MKEKVFITDKKSDYYGHWGYIQVFDGDVYHISGGSIGDLTPIFDRDQFKISKEKPTDHIG